MVAVRYEAKGFRQRRRDVFQITQQGKMVWQVVGSRCLREHDHDFAVTQKHIVSTIIPLAFDQSQRQNGGIHGRGPRASPLTSASCAGWRRQGHPLVQGAGAQLHPRHGHGGAMARRCSWTARCPRTNTVPLHADARWLALGPCQGLEPHHASSWSLKKNVKDYKMEVACIRNHLGALPRQDDRTTPCLIDMGSCLARIRIRRIRPSGLAAGRGLIIRLARPRCSCCEGTSAR